jgi:hypothetical protein
MAYDIAYLFEAIDKFSGPLEKMKRSLNKFDQSTKYSAKTLDKYKHVAATTFGVIMKLGAAFAGLGVYAIKNADEFEKMEIKLRAVTKTATQAHQLMGFVKTEAGRTGFGAESVQNLVTRLAIRGLPQREIERRTKQLETYSLATGGDLGALTSGYGKALISGGMQGRILTTRFPMLAQQIREMGIAQGKSNKEMDAFLKKAVGIDTINKAMTQLTEKNEVFKRSAEEMRGTIDNSLKRIHESTRIAAAGFGTFLTRVLFLEAALKEVADKMEIIAKFAESLNQGPSLGERISFVAKYQLNKMLNTALTTTESTPAREKFEIPNYISNLWKSNNPTLEGNINLNSNGNPVAKAPIKNNQFQLGYNTAGG